MKMKRILKDQYRRLETTHFYLVINDQYPEGAMFDTIEQVDKLKAPVTIAQVARELRKDIEVALRADSDVAKKLN